MQEAIKSVIDQDYGNIELIVIDDGSGDNSVGKIEEMIPACKQRFSRFEFRSRANKGLCATLNEALEWCNGVYVSPFASDDVLFPDRYLKQVDEFRRRVLERKNLVAIYSGVEFVDSAGRGIKVRNGGEKFSDFRSVFLRKDFLPSPTFLVLREKLLAVGGFNSSFAIEDFYIRLKLTSDGDVFFTMRDPLVYYRQHPMNTSKRVDYIWNGVMQVLNEYTDHPLYGRAVAQSMLIQAHDNQQVSKYQGFIWAMRAVYRDRGLLASSSMLRLLVKMFLPKKFVFGRRKHKSDFN